MTMYFCSGVVKHRELFMNNGCEDYKWTEEKFHHIVHADSVFEARDKVYQYYDARSDELYSKHKVEDCTVWETIE